MSTPAVLRTAEIVAVGSELLGSTRLDTNSLYIATRLADAKSSDAQPIDGGLKLMWQRLFRDAQAADAQVARI